MGLTYQKLPWIFTEGDSEPTLPCVYKEADLTGFTVRLRLKRSDGTTVVRDLTITDAAAGEFEIEWQSTDFIPGLNQEVDVEFVEPGGSPLTSRRFLIDVKDRIQ